MTNSSDPSSLAAWPERIVCLTEEPTEVLYALGLEQRIVGISGFTVRPPRARQEKPRVSAFTSAKIDQILALKPDLAIGFSDMKPDITLKSLIIKDIPSKESTRTPRFTPHDSKAVLGRSWTPSEQTNVDKGHGASNA